MSERLFVWGAVGFTTLLALLNPMLAAVFLGAVVGGWLLWLAPLRKLILTVAFLAMTVNNPQTQPASGEWKEPWRFLGELLFSNLKPLPFSVLDIVVFICLLRAWSIQVRRRVTARAEGPTVANTWTVGFFRAANLAIAAIVYIEVVGLLSGGDFKQSLYQLRGPLWVPCLALAVGVVADRRFLSGLSNAVLVAAAFKTGVALFVKLGPEGKLGEPLPYLTTHSDSVLWVVAIGICVSQWSERRTPRARNLTLVLVPWFALGIQLNNRRIAWVSLVAVFAFLYFRMAPQWRRQIGKALIALSPLMLAYFFVGMNRGGAIFSPARSIRSVVVQDDRSSGTRDIENYNLSVTFRQNPIRGYGYGREYIELVRADDISKGFEQYRYQPHNSFVGLWAFGGLLGASAYFLLFPIAVFLGVAAHRRSPHDPVLRVAGSVSGCTIIAYFVQAYGDVGMQDTLVALMAALYVGVAGALPRLAGTTLEETVDTSTFAVARANP